MSDGTPVPQHHSADPGVDGRSSKEFHLTAVKKAPAGTAKAAPAKADWGDDPAPKTDTAPKNDNAPKTEKP